MLISVLKHNYCKLIFCNLFQVEFNNPSSKIRFQCSAPPRMREKLSDKISVEEYVCTQPSTCAGYYSDLYPVGLSVSHACT